LAEAPHDNNGNGITDPVPFLGTKVNVKGAAAILAIMLAGLGYWVYDQVKLRDAELAAIREQIRQTERTRDALIDKLACKLDLTIFMASMPKGAIDWSAIPASLYECMPGFKPK